MDNVPFRPIWSDVVRVALLAAVRIDELVGQNQALQDALDSVPDLQPELAELRSELEDFRTANLEV